MRIEVSFKIPNSRAGAEVQADAAFSCTARRVSIRLTRARSLGFHGVFPPPPPLVLKLGFSAQAGEGGRSHVRRSACAGVGACAPGLGSASGEETAAGVGWGVLAPDLVT